MLNENKCPFDLNEICASLQTAYRGAANPLNSAISRNILQPNNSSGFILIFSYEMYCLL